MRRWIGAVGVTALLCAAPVGLQAATPDVRFLGFYDFNYFATDAKKDGATSGFQQGQFVAHAISSLSERTSFFGEVSLSPGPSFKIAVERAILKFEFNDYAKLSFGRYHTPINWWNDAFHHGLWLQTSIRRPEMTQFGGKFIPVHFVGALAQGGVNTGPVTLNYEAGLGNGRGDPISGGGDAGDVTNNRAMLLHVYARPHQLYQLSVGGSVYRDRITLPAMPEYGEWIAAAHVAYTKETPEILAEIAWVNHKEVGGTMSTGSLAYYAQAAYRLPGCKGILKPYARFEEMNIDDEDMPFSAVPDLRRYTAGVRADVSTFVALKVEYRRDRTGRGEYVNGFHSQLSLVF